MTLERMLSASPTPTRRIADIGVVLLLLAIATPCFAAERVVVFSFEGFELPKEVEMAPFGLANLVSRRLEEAGHEIIEPPLTLRDMMVAVGCGEMNDSCARKIAEHNGASRVVVGRLAALSGDPPDVRIEIRVHYAEGREVGEIIQTSVGELDALTRSFDALADRINALVIAEPTPLASLAPVAKTKGPVNMTLPLGLAAIGVGAAAAVIGSHYGVTWSNARRDYNDGLAPYVTGDAPPSLPVTDSFEGRRDLCEDRDARLEPKVAAELEKAGVFRACDRLGSHHVIAWTAGSIGVALLATGVALVIVGTKRAKKKTKMTTTTKKTKKSTRDPGATTSWHITPAVGPGFGGGTVTLSF